MAEPIEIVIRKTQETSTQRQTETAKKPTSDVSISQKAVNTALINAGKQIASYGLAQYGDLTGNTIAQRRINEALTMAGYVTQIAVGGWVGAIAVGTQIGLGAVSNYTATEKANQEANLLYQRSGNATIDGGRGTHD